MISFCEARGLLLQHTPLLPAESCRIEDACGRVLRQDVMADRPMPPYDRVMMDGYALRAADLMMKRAFRVTGAAPAGKPAATLSVAPWSCVEIMTGAPLPCGADCIVPVEMTTKAGTGEILVSEAFGAVRGRFIHSAGSDAREGEVLMGEGTLLGSREIGVAASCGAAFLRVSRLPRIGVLATGDELVAVDERPAAYQIRQSNAHAIRCALIRAGFPPVRVATLGDSPVETDVIERCMDDCDWLILTGAVSKGARDFVPGLLDSLGCVRLFHGVAQRPGKPAGCWMGPRNQVVMALPGNPVSALTGLHALVLPALAVASGRPVPAARQVSPAVPVESLPGMDHHLPVTMGCDGRFLPAPTGNSGDFIGLLKSDGFVTLPPRGAEVPAVPFIPWI